MPTSSMDRFLQPGYAIREIYRKAEPQLIFGDFVTGPIMETKSAFPYLYDSTGISGDTLKQTAPAHVGGADLPRIDFSKPTTDAAITEKKGFEVAVPRDVVTGGIGGEDSIARYFKNASYVLAEQINTAQLAAMTTGATDLSDAGWTAVDTWGGDDAAPVKDLTEVRKYMDQEGYPYKFTDGFVDKTNFYELLDYLNFYDGTFINKDAPFGKMIDDDTVFVSAANCTIHKVMSGLTENSILALDQNNPGAETHVYIDSKFGMGGKTISYRTKEKGNLVTKTVPNLGIHFYTYMEDTTKDQILQFWFNNKTVTTQALAMYYDTSVL